MKTFNIIKRVIHALLFYMSRFIKRVINSFRLFKLPQKSYMFVQMSVKWKGINLIPFNYGDDLNVFILGNLTKKHILQHRSFFHFRKTNYLCIGSIIESHCNNNSIIWGSGSMYGDTSKVYKPKKVCALRGPLTKRYLETFGVICPEIFGDPALLLPLIYKPTNIVKKYKLGIIPHYIDYNLPHVTRFREEHPEILFINMQEYISWNDIIDKINSCECIASSSLHGMIISDAYDIPNVQIIFSDNIAGGDFKYRDYCAGVQREYNFPINCKTNINVNKILDSMASYKKIHFDSMSLLKACPLPIDNKVSEMIGIK